MTGPLWHCHIERESTESVLILSISGRARMAAARELETALTEAVRSGSPVVIDLTKIDYISGAGLAAFQAAADGRDGPFVICGVRQPVEIAMELAGVFGHLAVEPTRSEAVARAKRAPHSR